MLKMHEAISGGATLEKPPSTISPARAAGIALAFFLAHVGLVTANIWLASSGGTRPIPEPPNVFRGHHQPWHPVLDLQRWDALLYAGIASQGYASPADPHMPSHLVAWFPGLPLLARGLHAVTGWSFPAALAAIGIGSTLAFWLVLWSSLARKVLGPGAVAAASALVVAWPGSFLWFAGMTEPLVALLSLVVILWWAEGRFWRAACVLALASATKQLFTVMALTLAFKRGIRSRPHPVRLALELLVALSGLLSFCAYCARTFGSPLVWAEMSERIFGPMRPLLLVNVQHYVRHAGHRNGFIALGSVVLLVIAAGILVPAFKREGTRILAPGPLSPAGVDLMLWALAASLTALFVAADSRTNGAFVSTFRYQTVNVPLLLLIGRGVARLPPRWRNSFLIALFVVGIPLGTKLAADYWAWKWVC